MAVSADRTGPVLKEREKADCEVVTWRDLLIHYIDWIRMAQMGTGSSQMSSPKLKHYSSYHQLDQLADHAAMVACLRDATTPPKMN